MGGNAAAQPTAQPQAAPADTNQDLNFDPTQSTGGSDEKPFDDQPFDAGVKADEDSDPKKYIEQLTGKLGQSLRKYNQAQGQPDFSLEKFAINSLLSATHTGEMDANDQKDIINKVKKAGDDTEAPSDGAQDTEQPNPAPDSGGEVAPENAPEPAADVDENVIGEMSLGDHNVKNLLKIYDTASNNIKQYLTRVVSYSNDINREEFVNDLQDEVDYEDIKSIFDKLAEMGISVPKEEIQEENVMLSNPKKNNMFQPGSNDVLKEVGCSAGYKQLGLKEENGVKTPNCIKIDETKIVDKKLSIFVDKSQIKAKLKESFNQEDKDMTAPATKPATKPTTKPSTRPDTKPIAPSRKNKPFLPNVTPGVNPDPKAVTENDPTMGNEDLKKKEKIERRKKLNPEVYHNSFSSAVQAANDYAEAKGYEVSEDDWFRKVSTGPGKPSAGNTNRYSIELKKAGIDQKKMLHIQVYNMGDKYELNCYVA